MDLGAALTGNNPNVIDRRNEPWPTATLPNAPDNLPQTPTLPETARIALELLYAIDPVRRPVPPTTALGIQAGVNDIGTMNKNEAAAFMNTKRGK